MKKSDQQARAARIRAAVTAAVAKSCASPGARIEEILGEEIARYPDQIMSLDVLPTIEMEFIGYDADFNEHWVEQFAPGKFWINGDFCLVGWKPIRMGEANKPVEPDAGFRDDKTCYEESEPYKGVPFCKGSRHPGPPCKDPFCYLRNIR